MLQRNTRLSAGFAVTLLGTSLAAADPTRWGVNGHSYELVPIAGLTWDEARTAAAAMSWGGARGHLATLTTQAENDFVAQLLAAASVEHYWIGGEQEPDSAEPGGGWRWITGEHWSYQNWGPGEPNNAGGNQDVLGMFGNLHDLGQWNDIARTLVDSTMGGFIVEYDTQGAIFVSGNLSGALAKFGGPTTADPGACLGSIAPVEHPYFMVLAPDGTLLVSGGNRVYRVDLCTNEVVGDFVAPGSGGLSAAKGLAFGPDGNLYVCSADNDLILKYDGVTGASLGVFAGPDACGLDHPNDIVSWGSSLFVGDGINGDGAVDLTDLARLLANFGRSCNRP